MRIESLDSQTNLTEEYHLASRHSTNVYRRQNLEYHVHACSAEFQFVTFQKLQKYWDI
jgi:hypothetical protein